MKSERITIIFLVLLCCSLVLTGCKDTEEEKATAESAEVKAAEVKAAAEKAAAEVKAAEVKFEDNVIVPLPANKVHRGITGSILELKDGSLFFVYSCCEGGEEDELFKKYPGGSIAGRKSTDLGRTWSKPFIVQPRVGTGQTSHPSLLRLDNGNILLSYDVQNKAGTKGLREGGDQHMYVRISTDECKSWSEQLCACFLPGTCHAMPDRLIQTSAGRIILAVESGTPVDDKRWVSLCYYSDNGGYSWWPSKNIVDLKGPHNSGTEEPVVAELKDGKLIMLCRTFVGYLCRSYSKDHGESWSEPELVNDLPSSIPSPLNLARIPDTNDLLVIWCHNPLGPERAQGQEQTEVQVAQLKIPLGHVRAPLTAAISQDGGKTWKYHRNITRDPEGYYGDYGYPCITFIKNGRVALVNYNAIDGIHLARIDIEWFYGQRCEK